MTDTLTPAQRRKCMAAIRGKDTKPERIVRSIAHRLGFRYRLHAADLPGKPDLVFRSRRAVLFVHGCYWHMHRCKQGRSVPATNAEFWRAKREGNRRRDRRAVAALRRQGWTVLVIWECQTREPRRVAKGLLESIQHRESHPGLASRRSRCRGLRGRNRRSIRRTCESAKRPAC